MDLADSNLYLYTYYGLALALAGLRPKYPQKRQLNLVLIQN